MLKKHIGWDILRLRKSSFSSDSLPLTHASYLWCFLLWCLASGDSRFLLSLIHLLIGILLWTQPGPRSIEMDRGHGPSWMHGASQIDKGIPGWQNNSNRGLKPGRHSGSAWLVQETLGLDRSVGGQIIKVPVNPSKEFEPFLKNNGESWKVYGKSWQINYRVSSCIWISDKE